MKTKLFACAFLASSLIYNSANASGFPVFDGANLTQMLQQMLEQAKDYGTQLDQLEKAEQQYKQQMVDATKPMSNAFKTANQIMSTGSSLYQYSNNLSKQFGNANGYLNNMIGSREDWENCAMSTSCNPMDKLFTSYDKLSTIFTDGLDQINKVRDLFAEKTQSVADSLSSQVQNSTGMQGALEANAQIGVTKIQMDSQFQQAVLAELRDQNTYRRMQMEKERAQITQSEERRKKFHEGGVKVGEFNFELP